MTEPTPPLDELDNGVYSLPPTRRYSLPTPERLAELEQAEQERDALRQQLAAREKDWILLNRMYDRMHDEYAALKEAADLTERIQRLADAIAALAAAQEPTP